VGLIESLFGDKKTRRQRRRKKAVKKTGGAIEDAASCGDGCCLDFVVPLSVGAVAGRALAKRSRRR
jgi:hypothetical protein